MKKRLRPLMPAALYASVSCYRQDLDPSVSAQLREPKEHARANGYSVAREYVDEAKSGRVADRRQFREMIDEGSKPKAPFEVIFTLSPVLDLYAEPASRSHGNEGLVFELGPSFRVARPMVH